MRKEQGRPERVLCSPLQKQRLGTGGELAGDTQGLVIPPRQLAGVKVRCWLHQQGGRSRQTGRACLVPRTTLGLMLDEGRLPAARQQAGRVSVPRGQGEAQLHALTPGGRRQRISDVSAGTTKSQFSLKTCGGLLELGVLSTMLH